MSGHDPTAARRRVGRKLLAAGIGTLVLGASAALGWAPAGASAPPGSVSIRPVAAGAPSGPYQDGETVNVVVGPNRTFQPGTRVNVLECTDPGGSAANLPKNDSACDGLTIQGNTVLVQADGSVSVPGYTLYRLPNSTLGEPANAQPVCNESNPCVLYVGENQNAFSQPKLFSAPFTVTAASALSTSTTSTSNTSTSNTSTSTATPVSPSVTLPGGEAAPSTAPATDSGGTTSTPVPSAATQSGTLAATGAPRLLPLLVASGLLLAVTGALGRRRFNQVGS